MSDRAQMLHRQIRKAVRTRRTASHRLARLLAEFDQDQLWARLRYASLKAYGAAEHDLKGREVRDLLYLGRRLRDLPQLDKVLASGEVEWTKARAVLPVITADNEAAWVERTRVHKVRELEAQVAIARRGEAPPDPREARGSMRDRLVLDLPGRDKQAIRDTIALVRAQSGGVDISDGEILAMICATYAENLQGHDRPTGQVHQVVVQWCPECDATHGVDCELTDTQVSEACCNPEIVEMRPGKDQGTLTRKVPPRIQRIVLHRAGYQCEVPGCTNRLWLHIHHLRLFSEGGDHTEHNLACLCSAHHRETHDGLLAIERLEDGSLRFERADGRVLIAPPPTHVGCSGSPGCG